MSSFEEIKADAERDIRIRDAREFDRYAHELEAIGTLEALALAGRLRGLDMYRQGYAERALDLFHASLDRYHQIDNAVGTASVLSNIASVHAYQGDHTRALELYSDALQRFELLDDVNGTAHTLNSIGYVKSTCGATGEAVEYHHKALELFTRTEDHNGIALVLGNIADVYTATSQYADALETCHSLLALSDRLGMTRSAAGIHNSIGIICYYTADYPTGLEHYHRALVIYEALNDLDGIARTLTNIGNVFNAAGNYDQALRHYERVMAMEHVARNDYVLSSLLANIGIVHQKNDEPAQALDHFRRALELKQRHGEHVAMLRVQGHILELLIHAGEITDAETLLATLGATQTDSPIVAVSIELSRASLHEHYGRLDDAQQTLRSALDITQRIHLPELQIELHRRLRELALAQQDLAGYVAHNTEYARIMEETTGKETATKLAMQSKQREIDAREREHEKQLAVLHSTLPKEVAERVARGEVVNDHFEGAAVIFLDIVGFTDLSSAMSSQEVITLLDDIFTQCDAICAKHSVTKIKTIGDSYMCVSFDNVINAACAAVEMSRIQYTIQNTEFNPSMLQYRIGVHCGPVTAGVIGKERMQYDVWGDTVNVASRMESSGEAGRIHVSQAFADNLKSNTEYTIQNSMSESENQEPHEVSLVTSHLSLNSSLVTSHLSLSSRGFVDIKGKGPMQTYWLENTP
jgi:adenylate cyclase